MATHFCVCHSPITASCCSPVTQGSSEALRDDVGSSRWPTHQRHRRCRSPATSCAAQRARIAANVVPRISEETATSRLRKYRETIARRQDEHCLPNLTTNLEDGGELVSSRLIVARMMAVSDTYVGYALRLQREAPELFRQVWSGQMTMPAALRELTGGARPEFTQALRASEFREMVRHQVGRVRRSVSRRTEGVSVVSSEQGTRSLPPPAEHGAAGSAARPQSAARLNAVLDEFEREVAGGQDEGWGDGEGFSAHRR